MKNKVCQLNIVNSIFSKLTLDPPVADFRFLYFFHIFGLSPHCAPIILPTRSTLRPDPSLRLRQSFARLLRSFSLHPVSVFVWVRPAFRSRAVGGVSSRGAAPNPAKTLCWHLWDFKYLWVINTYIINLYFLFTFRYR